MGPVDTTKTTTAPPASLTRVEPLEPATVNADGCVLVTDHLTVRFGGLAAVDDVEFRAMPGEVDRPDRQQRRREVDAAQRHRRATCPPKGTVQLLGRDVSRSSAAPAGPARARPHVPGRDALPRAHRARHRAARARSPRLDVVLGFAALGAVDPARAAQVRGGARAHRLPRPRPLRRPVRRRALDRHPPHRRARDGARRRAPCDLPRRADRRRRAARGRGVRSADPARAAGARRHARGGRARPAADPVDQRPRVLPGGRPGHRRGSARRWCATTRASSPRTSAPTTAPSSAATPAVSRSIRRRSDRWPSTLRCSRTPATPWRP